MRVTVCSAARSVLIALSDRQAIALYVAGIVVETIGVSLIPAYGMVVVGAAIAACGLGIAAIGNRYWPAPEHGVSVASYVTELISSSNRTRRPAASEDRR